jgi:peptidoglycan-associated lipoprotein
MSSHPSHRRSSRYLLSQLDRNLIPALLVIGVAGACSHTQTPDPTPAPPVVATQQPARRPPPPAPEPAAAPPDDSKSNKELAVYFDFDSALLRDDARPVLQKVAAMAKNRSLRIEGNCDEVGTVEYNLALGEHRAIQAKDYLTKLGVPAGRIKTVSYGSQHPKDPGHDDSAHAQNRRDDFILK